MGDLKIAFNFRIRKMVWEKFIPRNESRWRRNDRRRRKKNEQHWLPVEYFLNCCKLNSIEIFWMTLKWFDTCIEVKWHKKNNLAPSVQIKWKKNIQWAKKTQKAPNRFLDKWPNRHISVKFEEKKQLLFRCYHFGFDIVQLSHLINIGYVLDTFIAKWQLVSILYLEFLIPFKFDPPCTNVATVATNEIRLYRLRTINQCERRVETTEIE